MHVHIVIGQRVKDGVVKWSRQLNFFDGQNLDPGHSSVHGAYGSDLPCFNDASV